MQVEISEYPEAGFGLKAKKDIKVSDQFNQ